ncbi:hypothetical protein RFI_37307, partial [Reticulomyxa filosa]
MLTDKYGLFLRDPVSVPVEVLHLQKQHGFDPTYHGCRFVCIESLSFQLQQQQQQQQRQQQQQQQQQQCDQNNRALKKTNKEQHKTCDGCRQA